MRLIDLLLSNTKNKKSLFEEECEALDMNEYQKEDCKKSGLSPEEWLEANEPEHYEELDK